MEKILEFQKWLSDCDKDGEKKLGLSVRDRAYCYAVMIVKLLMGEKSA